MLGSYLDDAFERSEEVAPGTSPLLFSAMVAKSSSVESDTMDDVVVVLLLRNASEKNSHSASSHVWLPSHPPDDDILSLTSRRKSIQHCGHCGTTAVLRIELALAQLGRMQGT